MEIRKNEPKKKTKQSRADGGDGWFALKRAPECEPKRSASVLGAREPGRIRPAGGADPVGADGREQGVNELGPTPTVRAPATL